MGRLIRACYCILSVRSGRQNRVRVDGDVMNTEPQRFGPRLPTSVVREDASKLRDQTHHGVERRGDPRGGMATGATFIRLTHPGVNVALGMSNIMAITATACPVKIRRTASDLYCTVYCARPCLCDIIS